MQPYVLGTTRPQTLHSWLSCVDFFISGTISEFVPMPIRINKYIFLQIISWNI
jgi:hypothetical protein